jgi:hypothetical protein
MPITQHDEPYIKTLEFSAITFPSSPASASVRWMRRAGKVSRPPSFLTGILELTGQLLRPRPLRRHCPEAMPVVSARGQLRPGRSTPARCLDESRPRSEPSRDGRFHELSLVVLDGGLRVRSAAGRQGHAPGIVGDGGEVIHDGHTERAVSQAVRRDDGDHAFAPGWVLSRQDDGEGFGRGLRLGSDRADALRGRALL